MPGRTDSASERSPHSATARGSATARDAAAGTFPGSSYDGWKAAAPAAASQQLQQQQQQRLVSSPALAAAMQLEAAAQLAGSPTVASSRSPSPSAQQVGPPPSSLNRLQHCLSCTLGIPICNCLLRHVCPSSLHQLRGVLLASVDSFFAAALRWSTPNNTHILARNGQRALGGSCSLRVAWPDAGVRAPGAGSTAEGGKGGGADGGAARL